MNRATVTRAGLPLGVIGYALWRRHQWAHEHKMAKWAIRVWDGISTEIKLIYPDVGHEWDAEARGTQLVTGTTLGDIRFQIDLKHGCVTLGWSPLGRPSQHPEFKGPFFTRQDRERLWKLLSEWAETRRSRVLPPMEPGTWQLEGSHD